MLDRAAPELLLPLLLLLNRAAATPDAAASARGLPGNSPASGAASRPTVASDTRLAAAAATPGVAVSTTWAVLLLLGNVPASSCTAVAAAGPEAPAAAAREGCVATRLLLTLDTLPLSRRSKLPAVAPSSSAAVGLLLLAGLFSKPLRSVLVALGLR
jgi:hypothetical protein